jgi:metallo-beta-lactamase class B
MRLLLRLLCIPLLYLAAPTIRAEIPSDWITPIAPFRIADNLYYVGSRDLASYLITTPAGNILINASLDTSPPLIRTSVEQLGFRWQDIRILLNGQAHSDHVGGAAQVLRETHAQDIAMEYDAEVMRTGGSSDFAHTSDGLSTYAPVKVDRVLHDGDTVTLGDPKSGGVTLTAHRTGGHTRGCTTWTFRTHMPADPPNKLRNVVIIGGLAALSGYRLIDKPGQPASYPDIANDFAHTFTTLESLPCDIFLGAHGSYFNMLSKIARLPTEGPSVWIDPTGYQRTITQARKSFEDDLAKQEQSAK